MKSGCGGILNFKLDARIGLIKGYNEEAEQTYQDYRDFRTGATGGRRGDWGGEVGRPFLSEMLRARHESACLCQRYNRKIRTR